MQPNVTVLICNYNYDEYLDGCLKSISNQTYQPCKICFIDDKSDNQEAIVKKYIIPDSGFNEIIKPDYTIYEFQGHKLIFLNKNVGPSEARNIGIEETINNTNFYQILDADDELYPNKIRRLLETALIDPAIGVVYADYDILNMETGLIRREFKEPFDKLRLSQECIVHSGALISAQALKAVKDEFGYYDRNMLTCEDFDLWMRISEKFMIFHVAESLTLVRVHSQNSTNTRSKAIWEENWKRIVQKTQIRHGKNG